MTHKTNKEKNSKVELEVTLSWIELTAYRDKALKVVQSEIEMDGFRKGNAPEEAIIAKYGEGAILNEMANIAINETYPKIMLDEYEKNNIRPIDSPHLHIVSLEADKDFTYHAHVAVYPEITLPDYKSLAAKIEKDDGSTDATDEEVEKVINSLDEKIKAEIPDLKEKITENIKAEKEMQKKSKTRSKMLSSLVVAVEGEDKEKAKDMWPEGFVDRDKAQIIILEISKKENLIAGEEEIIKEMTNLMMHMGEEGMKKNNLDEVRLRSYAEQVVINEKVLSLLEKSP